MRVRDGQPPRRAARARRALAASILLPLALFRCGADEPDPPWRQSHAAIVDGHATGDYPSVVAVLGSTFCTGTVIAPHFVLTAAHCIHGPAPRIMFGSDLAHGVFVAAGATRVDPAFNPTSRLHDVAVVVVGDGAPSDVRTAVDDTPVDPRLVGAAVTLVGFGLDAAQHGTPGTRRVGVATIESVEPGWITVGPGGAQSCFGDSGGPVLAPRGEGVAVIGVISSGDAACADWTRAASVADSGAFLADTLRAFGAATAATGARCVYDAQCRSGPCVLAADDPTARYCSAACARDADCPGSMRCGGDGGARTCRYPLPTPGALGTACASGDDCASGLCARASRGSPYTCVVRCGGDDGAACRPPFVCAHSPDVGPGACFAPVPDAPARTTGGCRATPTRPTGPSHRPDALCVGAALWCLARRRRGVRCSTHACSLTR